MSKAYSRYAAAGLGFFSGAAVAYNYGIPVVSCDALNFMGGHKDSYYFDNNLENKFKQVMHVLGVSDKDYLHPEPFNCDGVKVTRGRWSEYLAIKSLRHRYEFLTGDKEQLPIIVNDCGHMKENDRELTKKSFCARVGKMNHGDYLAIAVSVPKHLFFIHVVKEQNRLLVILSNKGSFRQFTVLSFAEKENQQKCIASLHDLLRSKSESTPLIHRIKNFFGDSGAGNKAFEDFDLSQLVARGRLRACICTVANSNIIMLYHMATKAMRLGEYNTFEEAYAAKKPEYKRLRMWDRAYALKAFVLDADIKKGYCSETVYKEDFAIIVRRRFAKYIFENSRMEEALNPIKYVFNASGCSGIHALEDLFYNVDVMNAYEKQGLAVPEWHKMGGINYNDVCRAFGFNKSPSAKTFQAEC